MADGGFAFLVTGAGRGVGSVSRAVVADSSTPVRVSGVS